MLTTIHVITSTWLAEHLGRPLGRHLVRLRGHTEDGQTTAEYALVILGAAAVALLVVAWATKTSRVGRLLDAVVDSVISKVT